MAMTMQNAAGQLCMHTPLTPSRGGTADSTHPDPTSQCLPRRSSRKRSLDHGPLVASPLILRCDSEPQLTPAPG
eukprot:8763820-Pyramimonas_sp.AAC.2